MNVFHQTRTRANDFSARANKRNTNQFLSHETEISVCGEHIATDDNQIIFLLYTSKILKSPGQVSTNVYLSSVYDPFARFTCFSMSTVYINDSQPMGNVSTLLQVFKEHENRFEHQQLFWRVISTRLSWDFNCSLKSSFTIFIY